MAKPKTKTVNEKSNGAKIAGMKLAQEQGGLRNTDTRPNPADSFSRESVLGDYHNAIVESQTAVEECSKVTTRIAKMIQRRR